MSFRWASDDNGDDNGDDDDGDDCMARYGTDLLQRFHSILYVYNDKIEIKKILYSKQKHY